MTESNDQQLNVGNRVEAYDPAMMNRPVMGTIESRGMASWVFRVELDEQLSVSYDWHGGTIYNFYRTELTKLAVPNPFEVGQRVRVVANHGPSKFDKYVGLFGTITGNLGVRPSGRYLVDIDGDFDEGPETVAATHDELEPASGRISDTTEAPATQPRLNQDGERIERLNQLLQDERTERAKAERSAQEAVRQKNIAVSRIVEARNEADRLRAERDTAMAIEKANKLEAEKRTQPRTPGEVRVGDLVKTTAGIASGRIGTVVGSDDEGFMVDIQGHTLTPVWKFPERLEVVRRAS